MTHEPMALEYVTDGSTREVEACAGCSVECPDMSYDGGAWYQPVVLWADCPQRTTP